MLHPGVLEVAAVGIADEKSGEAVKIFVVQKDPALTAETLLAHCRQHLTGYKVPKVVEFRTEPLPKTNIGKILRRELRTSRTRGSHRHHARAPHGCSARQACGRRTDAARACRGDALARGGRQERAQQPATAPVPAAPGCTARRGGARHDPCPGRRHRARFVRPGRAARRRSGGGCRRTARHAQLSTIATTSPTGSPSRANNGRSRDATRWPRSHRVSNPRGRSHSALRYAERLVADDPLLEHAHRRVMRLHYLRGDRAGGVDGVRALSRCAERELDAKPGEARRSTWRA